MSIFYKPADAVAGDFIPFYWRGEYHLFYLKDWRDREKHGPGTPWYHLVTRDFVNFEERGEAIPRGPDLSAQDLWIFTGSVIERDGLFHIFYTGHNSFFKDKGQPIECVMHATSPDLNVWTKDAQFKFFAPEGYEKDDWRDPFVYWDERFNEYGMLLAARRISSGPSRNRGCTALATSPDLAHWTLREPFWAPDEYFTHECPDLFRIGEWWYLVYSTFSERVVTHYRMSRSLSGPWLAPVNPAPPGQSPASPRRRPDGGDTFDGRPWYAAKTAGDGERRYAFGWLATRAENKDDGGWQWGGNLVVHEVVAQPDGTLTVRMPEAVCAAFTQPAPLTPRPILGEWRIRENELRCDATSRCSMMLAGPMPEECLVETTVAFSRGMPACGLLLRADDAAESYYQLRIEPQRGRIVFDRWPRPGDQPFMIERPLVLKAGKPVVLRVLVSGSCIVAYANDKVALSCRMYNRKSGQLGFFATEGRAKFTGTSVRHRITTALPFAAEA